LFLAVFFVPAQNKNIDTLLTILIKEEKFCPEICEADTNQLKTLNSLSKEYRYIGQYETAMNFANSAIQQATLLVGNANFSQVVKRSARLSIASSYNNIGSIYDDQGDYSKALEYYLKSLKINEELKNKVRIATILSNIGIVYRNQKNFNMALEYYFKALKINEELGNKMGIAIRLGNIGNVYNNQGNFNKALEFYLRALQLSEELGEKKNISAILGNIGGIYQLQKDYTKALEYYFSALNIHQQIGNKSGVAANFGNIGSLYTKQKKYNDGEKYLLKAIELAKEIGAMDLSRQFEQLISELYLKKGDYKSAYEHHCLYSAANDSIFTERNSRNFNEMSAKYESEKKSQELKLIKIAQEKERAVAASESKRQQLFILFISAISLAVALIATIIFRSLRTAKKQKQIIELQKNEVFQQKQIVEAHQKEIIDSITYAKRLQEAILPPLELIKKHFTDSFVLYKPKDIVAGDFYWMETFTKGKAKSGNKEDEIVMIAAADCTGHGVPGALVSVVCSNALNRAVKEFDLSEPGKILDKTRELVTETFERQSAYGENKSADVKDGMDISLICIDKAAKKIFWSGANNPLWYIQNISVNENEFLLKEIAPNKQAIGKTEQPKPFTTHEIEYKENAVFYLFTDGFPDQFGGEKGKKFKHKQLKDKLLETASLKLWEQKEKLALTFDSWKGGLEQVDDVCVIGVKI